MVLARDTMVTPTAPPARPAFKRLNLDLPADLHEIRRRDIEAIGRVNRIAIKERKQVAPPGGEPPQGYELHPLPAPGS